MLHTNPSYMVLGYGGFSWWLLIRIIEFFTVHEILLAQKRVDFWGTQSASFQLEKSSVGLVQLSTRLHFFSLLIPNIGGPPPSI